MARVKHVYDTSEIPHLWVHQWETLGNARNKQQNLYFEGPTIFSYGGHFPIARFVENKRHKRAVLFTTRTHGNTTAQHIHQTRWALQRASASVVDDGPQYPIFEVHLSRWDASGSVSLSKDDLSRFRREYVSRIAQADKDVDAARGRAIRLLGERNGLATEARQFCKFFGLRPLAVMRDRIEGEEWVATRLRWQASAQQAGQNARAANSRRRVVRWSNTYGGFDTTPEAREKWLNGENIRIWSDPTLLRVKGGEVQTSRGATFPIKHARLGLAAVRRIMASGVEYVRNGHTIHLGNYAIDKITVDGTVYAGCHVVPWSSIERILPQLEAANIETPAEVTAA